MGLPSAIIEFQRRSRTVKFRSRRGVVALILKDSTAIKKSYSIDFLTDINETEFTKENYDYIRLAFLGKPSKVIIEVINDSADSKRTLDDALKALRENKFNYLAIPFISEEVDKTKIVNWIKTARREKEIYKAVLPSVTNANEKAIINFATTGIKVGEKSYTTAEYTARLAGILAGISLSESCTYFVLDEVTEIEPAENPDEAVEEGKLILINNNGIRIARGVNSLITLSKEDTEDLKKIKIVEAIDMIQDDIMQTWNENYVGKVTNKYDNKILFLSAVNNYFKELQRDEVLDNSQEAYAQIDIEAHKKYLKEKGIDYSEMTEQQIKEANTGSYVFVEGNITITDAMEDLKFKIYM
ncbi:XkdK-like protein [Clostridioides difficile]|nr:XkdK-like protein [Clostridioides difficile]